MRFADIRLMEEVVLVLNSCRWSEMCDPRFRGSGSWSTKNGANKAHIEKCSYLIITWHGKRLEEIPERPYGAAYRIGRNLSVFPSVQGENRFVIRFEQFANIIPRKDTWPRGRQGDQRSVKYQRLEDDVRIHEIIEEIHQRDAWCNFPTENLPLLHYEHSAEKARKLRKFFLDTTRPSPRVS